MLLLLKIKAQQTVAEQQLEALSEVLEDELEDDTYLQQLVYLQRHPLNVNTASVEDLQVLKLLTPLQVHSLLAYRKVLGPFIDLHELQAVPHWDVATISKVLPFLAVQTTGATDIKTLLQGGEHVLLARHSRILQQQKGYDKSLANRYAGSADKVLLRYKYQYKNALQFGVVAEKDAGERALKTFQNPFDFQSAHFYMRNRGMVKALAVGDFTINLGQGLVQWQALAFKKAARQPASFGNRL